MRIGILGAGWAGSTHAAAYARLGETEDVEIAGIESRKRRRAAALAKQVGCPAFTDPAKVLGDDATDAIDVTVPSGLYRSFAVAALNQGKHVFVETPMALSLADADAMIRAAKANRRLLLVARLTRIVAANVHAHRAIAAGDLGRPRVVVARRLLPLYWPPQHPRPFSIYGEPVIELMIFDFDAANWFLGRPRKVWASGVAGRGGASEHTIAAVKYDRGRTLLEGSARMPRSLRFTATLRVVCDRGMSDFAVRFTGKPIPRPSSCCTHRGERRGASGSAITIRTRRSAAASCEAFSDGRTRRRAPRRRARGPSRGGRGPRGNPTGRAGRVDLAHYRQPGGFGLAN